MDLALRDEAVELLRDLVRVDSSNPPGRETPVAMVVKQYLEANGLEVELVARDPERANLITRLPGTGDGPSLALMGHTDVVPADAEDWTHPPFGAHLDDGGYIWGRGTCDMKNELATRCVTIAHLARTGFQPRGDLLLISQADEEDGMEEVGMPWLLKERPDLKCDYAIDEGGGIRLELADGRVVYTLQVGEKATLPATITALGEAGHASVPTLGRNAVPLLATLIQRLAAHRTRKRLVPAIREMIASLGIDPDQDLDVVAAQVSALHPMFEAEIDALLGITIAPTLLTGSSARNVLPGRASVGVDCRILPGDTEADLERELREALGTDIPYEFVYDQQINGGTESALGTPLHEAISAALEAHDPGAIIVPSLSTGFTDAAYIRQAFGTIAYGFWPLTYTPIDLYEGGMHNKDERIHRDDLGIATELQIDIVRRLLG
ncbi:MAG: M20/M25/M40 family metallo-hydrolase [Thermoleophilia bacterium]|nr:M20/M25/M40 family metallo-hydrolase [Thermoleophilia bacterium]